MGKMDGILELMTPEEVVDAPWFVDVWEMAGHMSAEEAEEWRQKIEAWGRFRCGQGHQSRRFNLSIVEPPDQFLS